MDGAKNRTIYEQRVIRKRPDMKPIKLIYTEELVKETVRAFWWKKVGYFADGVIYACGRQRKIVTPGNPDIYYEVKAQEVRWYRYTAAGKSIGLNKDK